jgi:hypothetical protein
MLAEVQHCAPRIVLEANRILGVFQTDGKSGFDIRIGRDGLSVEGRAGLGEDPRISMASAGNHDAIAARLGPHPGGIGPRANVAIADHRDLDGLLQGPDFFPAGRSGIHVSPGSRMEGNGLSARILTDTPDANRIPRLFVKPAPDLHGGRDRHGIGHGPGDAPYQIEIPQTPRSTIPPDHLFDRAPEVDVDKIGAEHLMHKRSGVSHPVGLGPENLHPDGALLFVELEVIERSLVSLEDPLGAHELAHHHIRAKTAAEPPEGRLADPGLRREVERDGPVPKTG